MRRLSKVYLLLLHRYRLEVSEDDVGVIIDSDIRDVFLEELDEEQGNLRRLLTIWGTAPDDMDSLRQIRRVFHTLKGSGRLVGALPWVILRGRSRT